MCPNIHLAIAFAALLLGTSLAAQPCQQVTLPKMCSAASEPCCNTCHELSSGTVCQMKCSGEHSASGKVLNQKGATTKKMAMPADDLAKAVGRISNGLYVATAGRNNSRSAMLASWVSQASFKPMGLTIALAKDRDIEEYIKVGDTFVLNCLGEDNYHGLMKHFNQEFAEGQDRFKGVDWYPTSNGEPVLKDAIAHMECKVVRKMDANDHWVVYAKVMNGKVKQPTARTMMYRREVGSGY